MSETLSPSRAFAPPLFRPQLMIGAVTPLWGYFAGAAMTGVAMWWVSRWMPAAKPAALMETVLEPGDEPHADLALAPVASEPPPHAEQAMVVALDLTPVDVEAASAVVEPEPAAEPPVAVKLLAAPAPPRARKAKDAVAKPD